LNVNADLGEGAGADDAILACVDSSSIACAAHAGSMSISIATAWRCLERGVEIAQSAAPRPVACRSSHERIEAGTEIYVADTMGELGLFYRLASFAFIGKSLAGQGGQNPLEAARLGVAVVAGPHTENFREAYEAIFAAQGFGLVTSSDDLRIAATRLLVNPDEARHLGAAAARAVEALSGALERTRRAVETLLKTHACA